MLVENVTDALDHQDEMMETMGGSIKKVAKKLHRLELMMHNEPNDDAEVREKHIWQEKMTKLLKFDVAKRLPTLREVKLSQYKKSIRKSGKSGHTSTMMENLKRPDSRQQLVGKSLEKFRESKKQKSPGPAFFLGSKPQGEVIRVVKNYKGINCTYGPDRVLVTKEGRCGKALPPASSLPDWFCPGYYDVDKSFDAFTKSTVSSQVPFKNTGREPDHSLLELRRREMEQRSLLLTAASAGSRADEMNASDSYQYEYMLSSCGKTSPRYALPKSCGKPTCSVQGDDSSESPWVRSSAKSTIGRPVTHSGQRSPQAIYISPLSKPSLNHFGEASPGKDGYLSYDELVSDFLVEDPHRANSAGSSSFNGSLTTDSHAEMLSVSMVDSVLVKVAAREKAKYKLHDYTLGALNQQTRQYVVIPEYIDPNIPVESPTKSPSKMMKPVSVSAEMATSTFNPYAVTTAVETATRKKVSTSKAGIALNSIKASIQTHSSSVMFDEEIPFNVSLNPYVDRWREERSFVVTDPMRPRTPNPRQEIFTPTVTASPAYTVTAFPVHDDELLLQGATMTEEASHSLVAEFTAEHPEELLFR